MLGQFLDSIIIREINASMKGPSEQSFTLLDGKGCDREGTSCESSRLGTPRSQLCPPHKVCHLGSQPLVHVLLLVFQEPRELVDCRPDVGGRVQLASTWTGRVEKRGENVRRFHDLGGCRTAAGLGTVPVEAAAAGLAAMSGLTS